MDFHSFEKYESRDNGKNWQLGNVIEIKPEKLQFYTDKICKDEKCRFPFLTLRILIYMLTEINSEGTTYVCARRLAQKMDANYDSVNKCIKYLRDSEILWKKDSRHS